MAPLQLELIRVAQRVALDVALRIVDVWASDMRTCELQAGSSGLTGGELVAAEAGGSGWRQRRRQLGKVIWAALPPLKHIANARHKLFRTLASGKKSMQGGRIVVSLPAV